MPNPGQADEDQAGLGDACASPHGRLEVGSITGRPVYAPRYLTFRAERGKWELRVPTC